MKTVFFITLYSIVVALSFSLSLIFVPFEYVDNDHSYISCFNDGKRYETSPNYIFVLDTELDAFNDVKARKLCEHKIIMDYINSYPPPSDVNYRFLPALAQDSSWFNVVFIFFFTFLIGSAGIELLGKLFNFGFSTFGKRLFNILSDIIST